MTEMVSAFVNWVRIQHKVKAIVASTNIENVASSIVLKKDGFNQTTSSNDVINWKLNI
jgi:RimJ/RimL family protein N-acetyltransferase